MVPVEEIFREEESECHNSRKLQVDLNSEELRFRSSVSFIYHLGPEGSGDILDS